MINNSEKNRLERERIKIQKELYKANKLIRDQLQKEREEKELKESVDQDKMNKNKKKEKEIINSFSNISLEKLHDTSVIDDVSLSDMLGIKSNDFKNNDFKTIETIDQNCNKSEEIINENDRHYAPDFI
jgi:hypothetical protein